ncbi:type 2 isopentenyl-diphosphate Delta-isomerase [Pseudactinotalea sp. HY160]|uniref:type 2 isopentenyl-diphosphate Delta-isomerase n=1 Tax=Pseudactinotalea sp. HY160 TaxID=2654490 RepID=UPI00128BC7D7|nr:type 2 isopentenyl-diphosphate Delta-isomerase [Pseudactinotalea sp. HY160]MPV49218.1 type 2 isopentenyl-diphosphate Delta-isomerase [Pseudactinotalea sp. HY160]
MTDESAPTRAQRKDDHVRLAAAQQEGAVRGNEYDDLDFVHGALPTTDPDRVDLSVTVGDWRWPTPFYVNGMTGGTETTTRINRDLAIVAARTGMPMACGSVSVALDEPEAAAGFTVIRQENPRGFVMANLGVGRSGDDARRAVDLLEADALQLHLNAVQETAMPEGSCDFSTWRHSVSEIVAASPVPVIVKEVGFGLSRSTLTELADLGVQFADVSGRGGTDFLAIENARRTGPDYSFLTGFGQSALACLLDAPAAGPALLASGGVRNPYDVVKALAAGAHAVGVAGVFLKTVLDGGPEAFEELVTGWLDQTRGLIALLGAGRVADLGATDLLVRGRLREFLELRGVDTGALARRSTERRP